MLLKRRDGLISALLGLITCGVYNIYFWYQYGEDVNKVCRKDQKYTTNYLVAWILSCVTCGLYGIYWMYQLASRLDDAREEYGVHVESPVLFTLIMQIPFLSYFYACDVMNHFADAFEQTTQQSGDPRDYYYHTQRQTTPPPVWPTGKADTTAGADMNPNGSGFDWKTTVEDVGNNLKDKAKELLAEIHPAEYTNNQPIPKDVKYCENCGAQLEEGTAYCKTCGEPITKESQK